ncbi:reverse transcriptase domain-containing protein [Tanacetum coccineum]
MSAMANLTPVVTAANKEKAPDAAPRVNILDFCDEHYGDILPIIMEKARHDKRKEVQTRLNFGENPKKTRRERENSLDSRAENSSARLRPERSRTRGHERRDDRNVFSRLSHRRKSVHERLSDTYSPSTTRSGPSRSDSRNSSRSRGRPLSRERPRMEDRFRGTEESYDDTYSREPKPNIESDHVTTIEAAVEKDGGIANPHHLAGQKAALVMEETRSGTLGNAYMVSHVQLYLDGYKGLKAAFLAYFMQQKKYVKNPVEIHNIKQRDGETIEEFMKRFKIETGHMKGAPECMWISGFMHGVNNPELTKRLNEHVPKTMEEMMTVTTVFIRGEADAASKKKGHSPWKPQDQSKRHAFDRKFDFRGKFKPPKPMLKKQIEELVRAGKLSHLIKEIKQGRDQVKSGKKEAPTKDKSLAIYMIQQWQRTTKQKLTQSFAYGSEITFPPLANSDGTEGPLVIEAEIGGHMIHRIYIDGDHCTKAWMDFMIVRSISPYNGIIGRPGIREIQAVPSTAHGMLKFPADGGIVTIRSTVLIPAECVTVITSPTEIPKEAEARHKNLKVAIHPNFPDQEVAIGGTLSVEGRTKLCTLLKKNLDVFAWQPSDMTGVPRPIAEHRLNIREGYSPVRQKKRGQAPERTKAIQSVVQKLVAAGIMREVYYHDWLFNPVMDCYPLPEIDWKIESLCGYPFKCFLDAYKGYHQIQMAEPDEEKTAFHTSQGVYCYTKMPFGLKNVGATYRRLVDKAFESQVGRNMEVYVDDLVIKSHTEAEMLRDIDETFRMLQKINTKLNLKKYTFGAVEGVFLGYTITPEGIKPCPDKTEAVLQLPSPRTIKEVQSLNGKLASLNRFLSKSSEKSLPLFKTLKRATPASSTQTTPVYFISRALQGPELNYTPMEKLILSLVFAAKRLRRRGRAVTKMERHVGRTQYYIPSKNVGAGLILTSPEGTEFTYALRFQFAASNNEAEYEALIAGLRIAAQMGVRNVQVNVDSKLVANQVPGTYVAKEENMIKYLEKVKGLVSGFANFSINQVPRNKNKKADALSKITSTSFAHLSKQVLVEVLREKSIHGKEVTTVVEEDGPTWMTPIMEYLKDGTLPDDRKEASKIHIKARQYELMEGILYRRSLLKPWLRCVRPLQANYVIREIHEGSCSMHAGPRSVVAKAMRLGYYWPTMHRDARDMIRTCNDCQVHRPMPRNPQQPLTPITAPWPFYKWGIDIAGPFPEGPGEIISDNDKQFSDNPFKDWCDKLNITQRFASVKHPQSNGLMERANRSLGEGIKTHLGEGNKNWLEELSHVLWAHRTMIKSSHGDIPFSLTYSTKAVIPAEIGMPTYRTATVDTIHNDEELRLNLDLPEEKRERVAICEAKGKMKMANNDASHAATGGKLGPKWEGPYEVTEALGDGAYKLKTMDGTDLP